MFHIITSVWLIVKSTSASSAHISNLGLFILIGIPQSMIKYLVFILWCEKDNSKWQRNVNSRLIVNFFLYIWRAVTMKHFFLYIIIRNKRIISHKCVGTVLRMEAKQTFGRTCLRLFIVFTWFFWFAIVFPRIGAFKTQCFLDKNNVRANIWVSEYSFMFRSFTIKMENETLKGILLWLLLNLRDSIWSYYTWLEDVETIYSVRKSSCVSWRVIFLSGPFLIVPKYRFFFIKRMIFIFSGPNCNRLTLDADWHIWITFNLENRTLVYQKT